VSIFRTFNEEAVATKEKNKDVDSELGNQKLFYG